MIVPRGVGRAVVSRRPSLARCAEVTMAAAGVGGRVLDYARWVRTADVAAHQKLRRAGMRSL
ncbi:hypothetical protein [Frankia gtarii]|uniref:hypothetical protein n=1 Tax=Frankia gtarii TaxID=2950102 RepID=UPI0021BEC3E2|nr:hypothetical protein [Frankia gtarii]